MTLEETIEYHKVMAEEFRQEAERVRDLGEYISSSKQPYNEAVKSYRDCAEEHDQLAGWLEELVELRKFYGTPVETEQEDAYSKGYADGYVKGYDEGCNYFL